MTELSRDYEKWAARQDMDEAQNEISKLEATNAALVEALEDASEKILNLMTVCRNNGLANEYAETDWLTKARAALKLAEGE